MVRRSGRSGAALDWELDLLTHLEAHGLRVPDVVPTDDGRAHDDGVMVQRFLPGTPPTSTADWLLVVAVLRRVHNLTAGWPQRPGFASSRDLLTVERGGDVDLAAMPADGVALVRAAWRPLADGATCAIHGDVGGGNVLIHDGTAALIDWDESRVDIPALDYAHLPSEVGAHLPPEVSAGRRTLTRAGVAWEAATCWVAEPEYAARRLDELRQLR